MKVVTFGRAMRLAMLGGAIYYVRKHGGVRSTWNELAEKLKPLADTAKQKIAEAAQQAAAQPSSSEPTTETPAHSSAGLPDFGEKGYTDKTRY